MAKITKLTPREKEIIELKIKGLVDKQIANELGIKYGTVRTYIDRLKLKLNCCNTIQLNKNGIKTGNVYYWLC